MYKKYKRIINIITGIILCTGVILLLPDVFAFEARLALGIITLMVYWWITRPVHLAVTALMPIVVNAFYEMIPMPQMLGDYASPIVLLILGASILTAAWTLHGLDKRIALKVLSLFGTSVKQQMAIWFVLSVVMSAFLPNLVVVTALCPIAYAMMKYSGGLENSKTSYLFLLTIVWGAGLGGFGTPLGGAMNLVVISNIENYTGTEFMYGEWIVNMVPFLVILSAGVLGYLLLMKKDMKELPGSRVFFKKQLAEKGKMSLAEIISLSLFVMAVVLSFARPFYQNLLPGFKPPYAFLLMGLLAFFIKIGSNKKLMDWKYAALKINWGLMILFAGGLAAGGLIVDTGAADTIASLVSAQGSEGVLIMVIIITALGMFLANTSSNTAACAVLIPIVITVASGEGMNPLPYVFLTAAACNSAFALPTSIRAVPVGYGLDTRFMFKKGMKAILITYIILVTVGYAYIMIAG